MWGAGLGVHLLLVTQNFENQLPSQIAANAGLRICFRVQEAVHSKAVLNSPEAASIPKERIGRAFLRSHGGRACRISGRRGWPVHARAKRSLALLCRLGSCRSQRWRMHRRNAPIVDVPAQDTDMYAVVEVIKMCCREHRLDSAGGALAEGSAA